LPGYRIDNRRGFVLCSNYDVDVTGHGLPSLYVPRRCGFARLETWSANRGTTPID
jgi:hypothetical protein